MRFFYQSTPIYSENSGVFIKRWRSRTSHIANDCTNTVKYVEY